MIGEIGKMVIAKAKTGKMPVFQVTENELRRTETKPGPRHEARAHHARTDSDGIS